MKGTCFKTAKTLSYFHFSRRGRCFFLLLFAGLLIAGCQKQVCPEGSVTYNDEVLALPAPATLSDDANSPSPFTVEIRGKTAEVDRLIEGTLCNDHWAGTVYVGCNVQIPTWDPSGAPTFFEKCDLVIGPDTVVYVAAHNDTPYYKGCSCHTGGDPLP